MSEALKLAVVTSTTREGRLGEGIARWTLERGRERSDASFELVDLRDHPLPLFEAKSAPAHAPVDTPAAERWSRTMAAFDGYVFVTAEYNHSITGVLKNALDHLYPEVRRKPATFVGYGAAGGVRAVEHLRNVLAELQVATLRFAVHIGRAELVGIAREGKTPADFPQLADELALALDDLVWWGETLKVGRARAA